jgi:hypothetical protein
MAQIDTTGPASSNQPPTGSSIGGEISTSKCQNTFHFPDEIMQMSVTRRRHSRKAK